MKTLFFTITTLIYALGLSAQTIDNLTAVSHFHNDYIAVQRGNSWAFVNSEGVIVIDFRTDLVLQQCPDDSTLKHPSLTGGLALIQEEKDGIRYFGYVDSRGEVVIKPQFVNASSFNEDGLAIVHKLYKETLGQNNILNKRMTRYSYNEVIIDRSGKEVEYLLGPHHFIPKKTRPSEMDKIKSYFLSAQLVLIYGDDKNYSIRRITGS